MLLLSALGIALQISVSTAPKRCPGADSAVTEKRCVGITTIAIGGIGAGGQRRGAPRRTPVTSAHLATAFRDPSARTLLASAREARIRQDSALRAYDATQQQRMSLSMKTTRVGRERLLFRGENSARVRWQRGRGAWVDVTGARAAVPLAPQDSTSELEGMTAVIPYVPGQEELWTGTGVVRGEVDDRDVVHPLAVGAEAYYTYASGDSAELRLPDGGVVRIRELQVRPRQTRWNLLVGSLWFDADRGMLVRAAYRFAEPLDFWTTLPDMDSTAAKALRDEIPAFARALLPSVRGRFVAIALEYGLHEGRFWLPRLRHAEGDVQVSFVRLPIRIEERFRYASVNGVDTIPVIIPPAYSSTDSLSYEELTARREAATAARRAYADSVARGLLRPGRSRNRQCDTSAFVVRMEQSGALGIPIATRVPCDYGTLTSSPDLPRSIYESSEEHADAATRADLVARALSFDAQPAWAIEPPRLETGFNRLRYNRVEGLSIAAAVIQPLGAGTVLRFDGRLGLADLVPNAELALQRTNMQRSVQVGAYRRLSSVSDYGNPLSFGSSAGALLFGRDEGYYYRSIGVELAGAHEPVAGRPLIDWRLFAEQQRAATVQTDFALFRRVRDPNIIATAGRVAGGQLRLRQEAGTNPEGWRVTGDVRVEAAAFDAARTEGYARAALDVAVARPFGPAAGSLSVAGGMSLGTLPVQRQWYLGGTHTVRGQPFGTAGGDAFWLARAEIGTRFALSRPVLFADIGWAGDRRRFTPGDRPLSGVGVGASFVDGLLRVDVARGLFPERRTRLLLYVEGRF